MPNQRASTKKMVGFWLDEAEREKLARIAIRLGIDRTELIRRILAENGLSESGSTRKPTGAS